MKTLDEVIEAIEVCRDSYVAGKIIKSDALHYLKEYRSDKLQWEADKKAYGDERQKAIHATKKARERYIALAKDTKDELAVLRDFWAKQQGNPPLTWDELCKMKGKPVWVEWQCGTFAEHGRWAIVFRVNADIMNFATIDDTADGYNGYVGHDWKANYGTEWQAFRKERNEKS